VILVSIPHASRVETGDWVMIDRVKMRKFRRGLAAAAVVASSAFIVSPASAGQCPADKTKAGVRTSGEMKPKDVTDTVLGMIELGREKVALADRRLRLRRLVVQPGGIVPWHSHEDRPALIYVVSGQIHEYASNCAVPIEHKAGEVSIEKLGVQHWWKNNSNTAAVLLSADLFHDDKHEDEHTM
jgi:quercetin dioxygenase-like cupin family protein